MGGLVVEIPLKLEFHPRAQPLRSNIGIVYRSTRIGKNADTRFFVWLEASGEHDSKGFTLNRWSISASFL